MPNYAILDKDNIVCNVIIADSLSDAEFFSGSKCVEQTDLNGIPYIGFPFDGEYFIPARQYPSWIWDFKLKKHVPPIEKPEGDLMWDELSLSWIPNDTPVYPAP
jgi:hypothetical protein